jgi:hypothetical protein
VVVPPLPLPLAVLVPLLVALLLTLLLRRRRLRVSFSLFPRRQCTKTTQLTCLFVHHTEKEESDEDMGFGLFD